MKLIPRAYKRRLEKRKKSARGNGRSDHANTHAHTHGQTTLTHTHTRTHTGGISSGIKTHVKTRKMRCVDEVVYQDQLWLVWATGGFFCCESHGKATTTTTVPLQHHVVCQLCGVALCVSATIGVRTRKHTEQIENVGKIGTTSRAFDFRRCLGERRRLHAPPFRIL